MAKSAIINDTVLHVGDTVKVHYQLIEKEKEAGKAKREVIEKVRKRIQVFSGIVIGIKGEKELKTFTVRKIASGGIGVERIFPLNSPWIKKIEVAKRAKVRRAKLYFLRKLKGKKAYKLKELKKKTRKKKGKVDKKSGKSEKKK